MTFPGLESAGTTLTLMTQQLSIVIPAFNEEAYLGQTLERIHRSIDYLKNEYVEVIVVDNGSTDRTPDLARESGATVVFESEHNIAKVRNTGAKAANGELLVFIDADTFVPETLLWRVQETVSDPDCLGGSVDVDYQPERFSLKVYLRLWRYLGKVTGMAQGATQFCRREAFLSIGGYDENLYMGEDVDFYWRLKRYAKARNKKVRFLNDVRVTPSCRRYDKWPLWKILIWTHPLWILFLQRKRDVWRGWYQSPPR